MAYKIVIASIKKNDDESYNAELEILNAKLSFYSNDYLDSILEKYCSNILTYEGEEKEEVKLICINKDKILELSNEVGSNLKIELSKAESEYSNIKKDDKIKNAMSLFLLNEMIKNYFILLLECKNKEIKIFLI